ncbi:MAG: hypothetical protein PGN30_10115 [Mycolicibacterium neoaurum]|uniref:hypothetical protein n=1 Tax=Mycolicibacterium neoaurum TaxID=1795 RepID=UPI002FF9F7E6
MADLPVFSVPWNLYDIPGSVVSGKLIRRALEHARVVFTSNLGDVPLITFGGDSHVPPVEVYATVNKAGALVDRDGFTVKLLANDPGLSVSGVQWRGAVLLPVPGPLTRIMFGPFDAPVDGGVVPLSSITPTLELPPLSDEEGIIDGTPL